MRELNTEPQFSLYWENTITFAEHSQRRDWHLRPEEIPADALLRMVTPEEAFGAEKSTGT